MIPWIGGRPLYSSFIIGKRSILERIVFLRYLEHIYTNNQPETKEVLNELTRFEKNGPAEIATNVRIQKPQSRNPSVKMGLGITFTDGFRDWEFWLS